jgi:hypothetical protein
VLISRSKGYQEGQGQEVAIPRGYWLRPVEAVQTWLAAAEISAGPVFRGVALGGKASDVALADDSAGRIVKRRMRGLGSQSLASLVVAPKIFSENFSQALAIQACVHPGGA